MFCLSEVNDCPLQEGGRWKLRRCCATQYVTNVHRVIGCLLVPPHWKANPGSFSILSYIYIGNGPTIYFLLTSKPMNIVHYSLSINITSLLSLPHLLFSSVSLEDYLFSKPLTGNILFYYFSFGAEEPVSALPCPNNTSCFRLVILLARATNHKNANEQEEG